MQLLRGRLTALGWAYFVPSMSRSAHQWRRLHLDPASSGLASRPQKCTGSCWHRAEFLLCSDCRKCRRRNWQLKLLMSASPSGLKTRPMNDKVHRAHLLLGNRVVDRAQFPADDDVGSFRKAVKILRASYRATTAEVRQVTANSPSGPKSEKFLSAQNDGMFRRRCAIV